MGLEALVDYLDDLDQNWPLNTDGLVQADDHMRNTKKALKQTFPGAGGQGFATPITATEAELNVMDGGTAATAITPSDTDQMIVNDGGTMLQIALSVFNSYQATLTEQLENKTLKDPDFLDANGVTIMDFNPIASANNHISIRNVIDTHPQINSNNGLYGVAIESVIMFNNTILANAPSGPGSYCIRGIGGSATYGIQGTTNGGFSTAVYGNCTDTFWGNDKAVEGNAADASSFDFYASGAGTNYGPFTGGHDGLVNDSFDAEIGDILVDAEVIYKKNISNVICRMEPSHVLGQNGAVGVLNCDPIDMSVDIDGETHYSNVAALDGKQNQFTQYKIVHFNAVGEGQINVCGLGGTIEVGDLICASDMKGKGCRQSDDVVHSHTVAKARERMTFSNLNEVKQIACIYLCG